MLVSVSRSRAPTPGRQVAVSYHLLQGDPRFVHIDKQPDSALTHPCAQTATVRGARGIRSHRIDIGVFCHGWENNQRTRHHQLLHAAERDALL
ncbi:MAG: hypothetical protein IPK32_25465 [Verrucomicrobiaceae bacterium]|nr:hypothetical protein [Verrucomicrobiaceae bacterium]